ncbi:SdiA-regulated domain-containing protein [Danxiaibacter flavus]|uniref:SdiA-regulated domain-containing protein n=1 Tax=Danxiaibacter flavus TaxID=3049108 RepID=A0ABV3ZJX2_9BACT|nr:SdiA-regulated domain-containing protein [Chitinophagaceae bacterium DXS]
MKLKYAIIFSYLYIIITSITACAQKKIFPSPANYDLNTPEKFTMTESLQEISGITFNNLKNDTIYAIQDEEGKLFFWQLGSRKISSAKFGKRGDYEDLAILNNVVFVLRSDGTLYSFPLSAKTESSINSKEWVNLLPKGEYEGLHADAKQNNLYVLCKKCADDKSSKEVSGYVLTVSNDSLINSSQFSIDVKQIQALTEKKNVKFRPSALTFNLRTNEWFILSASNKMLVITDENWKVKQVFDLDPGTFLQPEGIAFDSEHNLYISNEGDDLKNGNVLKFKFLNK